MSNEQNQQTPNVYKTSKTTWFLIAFMAVILIIIIFMMTRKKKDGDGVVTDSGGVPSPAPVGVPVMK